MIKNSTKELLIKYIYRETSLSENHFIKECLYDTWELRELHAGLVKAKQELPDVKFNPKSQTIKDILKYGRSTDIEAQV